MTIKYALLLTTAVLVTLTGTVAGPPLGAEGQFRAFLERYDSEYCSVPFNGDRVRNLTPDPEQPAFKAGLKRLTATKYGEMDVHHRLYLSVYTYGSEEARRKALEGWLRRFSILGDPIVFGESARNVKSPPLFAVITATTIVVLSTRCETADEEWERNINDAMAVFATGSCSTLRVSCGGPVEWATIGGSAPN